jgi:alkanesulfonate monooxygenase SsuD/methylene tetrahydromethanopterin reductase-like flavin-dependent oxidoreductase (luciferase family)
MKFGVIYHGADPDTLVAFATQAEEFGFESFYLPEHVALAPGPSSGPRPWTRRSPSWTRCRHSASSRP